MVEGFSEYDFLVLTPGTRLDSALTELLNQYRAEHEPEKEAVSRTRLGRAITDGLVMVDFEPCLKPSFRVTPGMTISIQLPDSPKPTELLPDPTVKVEIVHEEADFLVVNKQASLVVHPGAGNANHTLVQGLLAHCGILAGEDQTSSRPGLVHRLDKDTTGLMVVAKTALGFANLSKQFEPPRTIEREYLALTARLPKGAVSDELGPHGTISLPIGRHETVRTKMAVKEKGGKIAVTRWRLEAEFETAVLLRLHLETGRTHQIRVHLEAVGAPIVGDPVYGAPLQMIPQKLRAVAEGFKRQALHAERLSFLHPVSGMKVGFHAPVPNDFAELLNEFKRNGES